MIGKVSFYGKTITGLNDDVRISKRLNIPSFRLRGFEKGKVGPIENNDYRWKSHIYIELICNFTKYIWGIR